MQVTGAAFHSRVNPHRQATAPKSHTPVYDDINLGEGSSSPTNPMIDPIFLLPLDDTRAHSLVLCSGYAHPSHREGSRLLWTPRRNTTHKGSPAARSLDHTGLPSGKPPRRQLHGKLDPHEVAKMREEWDQTHLAKALTARVHLGYERHYLLLGRGAGCRSRSWIRSLDRI